MRTRTRPPTRSKAREFGAEGIGLCRTEHMFFGEERLPVVQEMILADDETARRAALERLLPFQQSGLRRDLRGDGGAAGDDPAARPAAARVPAVARRDDRRAAAGRASRALHEANPMLGTRGCRLGLQWPEIYEMQVRAIVRAALAVRDRTGGGAARRDHAPARRLRRGVASAARAHRPRRVGGRVRPPVSRRDDDRAASRLRPRRRDRPSRRLLLLRHQRPDADRARVLARRCGGQVPHALPRGRACSRTIRSRHSTRTASAS